MPPTTSEQAGPLPGQYTITLFSGDANLPDSERHLVTFRAPDVPPTGTVVALRTVESSTTVSYLVLGPWPVRYGEHADTPRWIVDDRPLDAPVVEVQLTALVLP